MKNKQSDMELGKQLAELCGWEIYELPHNCNNDDCADSFDYLIDYEGRTRNVEVVCQDLNLIAEIEQVIIKRNLGHIYNTLLADKVNEFHVAYITIAMLSARDKAGLALKALEGGD